MASKFALVIANTEYQDASFAKLTAPGRDAEEFAQVLRELAAFDDVQVLLNEGEGKTRRSIARFFAERKRDDLLLLYFSGHGVRNDVGQLFLAAHDTEINILEASGIPAEFVTQSMNNSRSQRQLLILDCCNSGAFAYGSKSASVVGKSMGIASAFEGSGFGRVVLTATDATQYAWEGEKVIGDTQKSVFTHFLIEGLKGEADRDSDGRIHVDELYDYAYEQVVRRTPKQTPGKWSYKQQGDIILRENIKPREVKPAPLPTDLLEMLSHPNAGVRRVGIRDLISLLDGKHQGLARTAQEKLREIAVDDDSLTIRRAANDELSSRGFESGQPAPYVIPEIEEKKIERPVVKPTRLPELPKPVIEKKPGLKKANPGLNLRTFAMIVGGLTALTLLAWGDSKLFAALNPTVLTATEEPISTNTSLPNETPFPPTPELGIGSTMMGEDGMTLLYVPEGEFKMGSENGGDNEKPVHTVYLDPYWIDQTEVTTSMYAQCVQERICNPPGSITSFTRASYYGDPEFEDYPVIYVSWEDAQSYCAWADRRLPTEAEWEKAARGWNALNYPWGDSAPDSTFLNYYDGGVGDTSKVGSYPKGASPFGALDMAGNVAEWVADLYRDFYYADSPKANPLGPENGEARVVRGGAWEDATLRCGDFYSTGYVCVNAPSIANYSTWKRDFDGPSVKKQYYGFRCALSADEQAESSTSQPGATEVITSGTFDIGSTVISDKDGMTLLYIPAGEFTMGSDNGDSDEKPVHTVTLDSYWIDETEVTNEKYALCVSAGKCDAPRDTDRFRKTGYANHPVIYVSWNDATAYCAWAGRRLPTEAEWEKAAIGNGGRIYPWGNETPDTGLLNFNNEIGETTKAGNYPNGASPYGALDMAGNVWEWVADWYGKTYYASLPVSNPLGPNSGQSRVLRGGAWYFGDNSVRSANRGVDDPSYTGNDVGFRCSRSP